MPSRGRRLAVAAAVLAVGGAVALDALPVYRDCAFGSAPAAAHASPSPNATEKRYAFDPVTPYCRYRQYMDGSSGMAELGLLLVASLFGVLVVRTVRFPAITAALGLEWVAAWGYLIYWLSDVPDHWVRVQAVWRIGFYIPVGGQGYLWVMVPAGVLAIVAAAAQPRSRRALATTRF